MKKTSTRVLIESWIREILFVLGLGLLGVNISGYFFSLRASDIYQEQFYFENDIILTEEEFWDIVHAPYSSHVKFVLAATAAVNNGVAHYWGEDVNKYNLHIPFTENYLLFLLTHLYEVLNTQSVSFQKIFTQFRNPDDVLRKYEFSNYKKALERGVGLCSQLSIILDGVLKEEGVASNIVYLQGHVVVTVQIDAQNDIWWVADPDFGVIVQHDMRSIEQDPELIRPYYQEQGYPPETIDLMINTYAREGNKIYANVAEYHGKDRYYKYQIEYALYLLKWILPIGLFGPYSVFWMKSQRRKETL